MHGGVGAAFDLLFTAIEEDVEGHDVALCVCVCFACCLWLLCLCGFLLVEVMLLLVEEEVEGRRWMDRETRARSLAAALWQCWLVSLSCLVGVWVG